MGESSPYLCYRNKTVPKITRASSFTQKNSTSIMAGKVTHAGPEVIFSKSIPARGKTLWKAHISAFLTAGQRTEQHVHSVITPAGGKKVLEAMENALSVSKTKLYHSYQVLAKHGNMSSATVLYVLHECMKEDAAQKAQSILCALGPGFSSELLLLEWG